MGDHRQMASFLAHKQFILGSFLLKTQGSSRTLCDPEVLQSGFALNFGGSGELRENCRRKSQRILPANFSANFSALFLQGFRPPPPQQNKSPKIHIRNCRHSFQISHFKPKMFSRQLPKIQNHVLRLPAFSNSRFLNQKCFTPIFCLP